MEHTDSYSLKEVVENNFKEMREHLQDIKIQTTKTNGRVNSLENSRVQVWAAIGVLLLCGGSIIYLSIMAIDNKIQRGIDTAFNNKFDSIEVTNNNYGKTVNK